MDDLTRQKPADISELLGCIEECDRSTLFAMVRPTLDLLRNLQASGEFAEVEAEAGRLIDALEKIRFFERLHACDHLEPALRAALVAADGASQFNQLAQRADLPPVVSPLTAGLTALLSEITYAIDQELIDQYELDQDGHSEVYLQQIGIQSTETLRASGHPTMMSARLLDTLGSHTFALNVLRASHNIQRSATMNADCLFAALARANIGKSPETQQWGYWANVATVLWAMPPYAQMLDGLPPNRERWQVERSRLVADYLSMEYVLRIFAGVDFARRSFEHVVNERQQRLAVSRKVFELAGMPFPGPRILNLLIGENVPADYIDEIKQYAAGRLEDQEWLDCTEEGGRQILRLKDYPPEAIEELERDIDQQHEKKERLLAWIEEKGLKERYDRLAYQMRPQRSDVCYGMPELLRHFADSLNQCSHAAGAGDLFDAEYLNLLALAKTAMITLSEEERDALMGRRGDIQDFLRGHPTWIHGTKRMSPEELRQRPDLLLFVALKQLEDRVDAEGRPLITPEKKGKVPGLAYDSLAGMHNLENLLACFMYLSELMVRGEGDKWYTDPTQAFMERARRYTSIREVPPDAFIKLESLLATFWYLGIPLPQEGAVSFDPEKLVFADLPVLADNRAYARRALVQIAQVFKLRGVVLPPVLGRLLHKTNETTLAILERLEAGEIAVLIVEDQTKTQEELRQAVLEEGFPEELVWVTASVDEARLLLTTYHPQIVLLDYDLGPDSGRTSGERANTIPLLPVLSSYGPEVIATTDNTQIRSYATWAMIRDYTQTADWDAGFSTGGIPRNIQKGYQSTKDPERLKILLRKARARIASRDTVGRAIISDPG